MDDSPVVLVTGASSGTGLCAAVELARRGARVFGTMRDPARADALLAACHEAGVTVTVVGLDVRSASSVGAAVASVVGRAGRLDVLVNNAAAFVFAPVEFTTPEEVLTLVETNLDRPDSDDPSRAADHAGAGTWTHRQRWFWQRRAEVRRAACRRLRRDEGRVCASSAWT